MGQTMPKVNIAVVVGSSRRDSINRKLAEAFARLAGEKLAIRFVRIDDLPMFNQDLESPPPTSVARFKAESEAADAFLIFAPEHNRSIPALLKNAIDWGTRPSGQKFVGGKTRGGHRYLAWRDRYGDRATASETSSWRSWRAGHGRGGLC
jgi:chromate reductase, NAD(P)H dehydrogenase (quinone)